MEYGWQDAAVAIVVGLALAYLWRKLGPTPRNSAAQIIPVSTVKRVKSQTDDRSETSETGR